MKKILSLFIALMLAVSLFATTAVALAEEPDVGGEEPQREVGFDSAKFEEYVLSGREFYIEMSKTFMLDNSWLDDAAKVNEVFPGIRYDVKSDDADSEEQATAEGDSSDEGEGEEGEEPLPNDKIYVMYCNPSTDPRADDWSACSVANTFSVTSQGSWWFYYAVVDGEAAAESNYTFNKDDVLADSKSAIIKTQSQDTTHPVVSLSESLRNKQEEGLTVGTSYTVSTSLTIDDCSSTTVTYKVYKNVGKQTEGADSDGWLLIYDSEAREVTEGYEDYITTGGVITPAKEDVSDTYAYKVVYSVVDRAGFYGVMSNETSDKIFNPTLMLKVKENPSDGSNTSKLATWKIVLFVIAGVSALGIVILLCIKPKKQTADERYIGTPKDSDKK